MPHRPASFFLRDQSPSARIGFSRTDFKQFVSGEKVFAQVENWGEFQEEEREAILAAVGARGA
jgi:hypothetical protein